ncbi:MAG: preprotein translocase subunit SecA [Nitrospirae bacterium]|jgi:preprotein translocase subunit SecA|nr:preprotein translocase subunit SecA [Nitrospirota bacterium]MDA8150656.1 preprotein translocase subunit SecA [Nitrospiraceae bacterium]
MFKGLFSSIFPSRNDRELKRISRIIDRINGLEDEVRILEDESLKRKTIEFRERLSGGETLDDLLPEAFSVVREASRRILGMRHFDVQLVGGVVLHEGFIAEMKTGEGKTLVATLPVYLNALAGKGVHVVTVNDYLARRDSDWMGKLYRFLGLTTGIIQHDMPDDLRKQAYAADITYGTNNEFGFDYLRDNMKYEENQFVQRGLNYAIVDEVDSILIDESRTPLIISGPSEESTDLYYQVDRIIPGMSRETHFRIDEKLKTVTLTEEGNNYVEDRLGIGNLYDVSNINWFHHVLQALKAHHLYRRDVEYVVKNGEVIIVDEFTGRLMPGRRWGEGLHQAVEAKEKVKIEQENQTLATITFQNYFRMYEKLAGMTGTADTEAQEFHKIYNLDVIVVPTHRQNRRVDLPDQIYRTYREKAAAIVEDIRERSRLGQPVLVGTVSIEKSEHLSSLLSKEGIPHKVLNAKFHEMEAEIVSQAGRLSSVTIATNMAGRGTDIVLGGNAEFLLKNRISEMERQGSVPTAEEVEALREELVKTLEAEREEVVRTGGLHIIGTERHESRRIDNQLRGRSGRQGDPGSSRFYLSLDDDLLRIFGADRIKGLMDRMGVEEGVPIEHGFVTKAIENAQKKVEAHHFDIRKQLLEYDDVMNQQRLIFYELRRKVLRGENLRELLEEWGQDVIGGIVRKFAPEEQYPETWDLKALAEGVLEKTGLAVEADSLDGLGIVALQEHISSSFGEFLAEKERLFGADNFWAIVRYLILQNLDEQWKEHLLNMDHLKEGIGLRGYGQKDPLVEYRREGFSLFEEFVSSVQENLVLLIGNARQIEESVGLPEAPDMESFSFLHPEEQAFLLDPGTTAPEEALPFSIASDTAQTFGDITEEEGPLKTGRKPGRNDPCFCGSGKKYKKCHGA